MGETPDHKVNKPGGGVVDFTDIGTYVNLNPDEMSAYVDLEKGLLERDMEEIFGEDFSDHALQHPCHCEKKLAPPYTPM